MSCASCSAQNGDQRRFCRACGATLGVACARCSFRNEPADRYCGGCGAAMLVARGTPSMPVPRAEETAAAVLGASRDGPRPSRRNQGDVSRPPPVRSTVAPSIGALAALSADDLATLLAPRALEGEPPLPVRLTQEDLDRLFGRT